MSEDGSEDDLPEDFQPPPRRDRRRSSMHVEDDYLDGTKQLTIENYLKGRRRSSFRRVSMDVGSHLGGHKRMSISRPVVGVRYSAEPYWEAEEALIEPVVPLKWKENTIDKTSLYAIKREQIADRDLPFNNKRPASIPPEDQPGNIEHQAERCYINTSHLTDNTQNLFNKVVIQNFFKAPAPRSHPGYGMPPPDTGEVNPFRLLSKDLERDPSIVPISGYPDLTNRIRCVDSKFTCEILGPSTCGRCIERTNRHIGDELQRILFPKIEMNTSKLVKPKLARVLREGHLQNNRRLQEFRNPSRQDGVFSHKKQRETHFLQTPHFLGESGQSDKRSNFLSTSVSSRTTHVSAIK